MESLNTSIQLRRAAATLIVSIQAVSQWLLFLEENDGSERRKSLFQQRLAWDTYVANNKDRPIFKRHLRMTYELFRSLVGFSASMVGIIKIGVKRYRKKGRGGWSS